MTKTLSSSCLPDSARLPLSILFCVVLSACGGSGNDDYASDQTPASGDTPVILKADRAPFPLVEATVEGFHSAMKQGDVSCRDIVQGYLNRIAAYDYEPSTAFPASPALHSVIAVNTQAALSRADELDAQFFKTGKMVGPMHCVPVLAKDNIDTFDMKTTAGSLVMANNQPPDDAFIIKRIRAAGAIIIGKANLDEFAFGFTGSSSIGGKTQNAYIPGNSAGGSSAGTGTAIATNLAMVGLGTDTGGSVRVPSSVEGLYGLRPSLRLVSQDGIVPLSHNQDTAGPMCRQIQDCALAMDAMVGFDESTFSGQRSAKAWNAPLVKTAAEYTTMVGAPASYLSALKADGLKGARIGVVRGMFPTATTANQGFLNTLNAALDAMRAAGATVEDVEIQDRTTILSTYSSLSSYDFRDDLTAYLSSWSSTLDQHPRTTEDVYAGMLVLEPTRAANFNNYVVNGTNKETKTVYQNNLTPRDEYVIPRVLAALDNKDFVTGNSKGAAYDVLVYPVLQGFNGTSVNSGSNNRLSPFTGFPALTLPAGFIQAKETDSSVQPVGLEMLGRVFDEPTLFKLGYGWQKTTTPRVTSPLAPELAKK